MTEKIQSKFVWPLVTTLLIVSARAGDALSLHARSRRGVDDALWKIMIVAGGIPLSGGLALADRMQGRPNVTACFFGEGAVAEGEFHETMNLAALWDLPVLFSH